MQTKTLIVLRPKSA